jgi:GrpB-like predicted nucleotidyltransferase (UPF0157 family)
MSDVALTDEHLAALLVRGLRPTRVELVEYDPAWVDRYAARAAELRAALGPRARLVEHVGSTSVPGLVAKPVIDIVVAIDDPDDEPAYLPDLEAIGYDVRVRESGHRCLRAGEPDEAVNLHLRRPDDPEIRRHLVFRDRLRADEADRELYAATKRGLTDREWPDVNYYAEAKSPVIKEILRRAGWPGRPLGGGGARHRGTQRPDGDPGRRGGGARAGR